MNTLHAPERLLSAAETAALFAGQRLAIAPHWEAHFESGTLPTLLDKRRRAGMFDDDGPDSSESSEHFTRVGRVALLDIDGPLMQHGGWWFDGHDAIRSRIEAVAASGLRVAALRIDSPGGVVAGCFDNVRASARALSAAGVRCFVFCAGDGAFSAGYAWASLGERISVSDTSGCASVGVLSKLVDRTKMTAEMGLRVDVIRSGTAKADGNPDVKNTPEAIAREQAVVDEMAGIFAGIVGKARGMSPADVLGAEGATFYGAAAVAAGFADDVTDFDAFMARCQGVAEEENMKLIAQRLGLADAASEADIVTKIDALKADADGAKIQAANARADADKLGGELADVVCAEALVSGKRTAADIQADRAMLAGVSPAAMGRALRDRYAALARGAALPKETHAPAEPPAAHGAGSPPAAAKLNGAKMTLTEISAHAADVPLFNRLMAEHSAGTADADRKMFAHAPRVA